jgi:hypothetical protein
VVFHTEAFKAFTWVDEDSSIFVIVLIITRNKVDVARLRIAFWWVDGRDSVTVTFCFCQVLEGAKY